MAFIESYTTSKDLIKDLVTICTTINKTTVNASLVSEESRIVGESIATSSNEKKIRLVYTPLEDSTFIFKKNNIQKDFQEGTDFSVDKASRLITFTTTDISLTDVITVTYQGNKDWELVYPATLDLIDNKAIIKTRTSRIDSTMINSDLNLEPNITTNEISMYVQFDRPLNVVNPETGSESSANIGPGDTTILSGSTVVESVKNNHYIEITSFDIINSSNSGPDPVEAIISEPYKLSWFMDFKESLVDDYDQGFVSGSFRGTPTTGLTKSGVFLRALTMADYYNTTGKAPVKMFVNATNDRINLAVIGSPDISVKDYLVSYAYIGKIEGFKDKLTDKFYNKDIIGNFAITTGSSTIPSKKVKIPTSSNGLVVESTNNAKYIKNIKNNALYNLNAETGAPELSDYGIIDLDKTKYADGVADVKSEIKYLHMNKYLGTSTTVVGTVLAYDTFQDDPANWVDSAVPALWNSIKYRMNGIYNKAVKPDLNNGRYGAFPKVSIINKTGTTVVPSGKNRLSYAITFSNTTMETKPIYVTFCVLDKCFYRESIENPKLQSSYINQDYSGLIKPIIEFTPSEIDTLKANATTMNVYKANVQYIANNEDTIAEPNVLTEQYYHYKSVPLDSSFAYKFEDTTYKDVDTTTRTASPTASFNGSLYVTRDRVTGMINDITYPNTYGENTATGVTDIALFKTRMGVPWQKHHAAFNTNEEFMSQENNSPSKWTNRVHASPVYVYHMADGYRGQLMDVIIVDKTNLNTDDTLTLNKGSASEIVYKLIKIKVPYSFINSSANHNYTIGIRMN